MPPHNHTASCSHDCADHDHSSDITPAVQSSLHQHIDFDAVRALNEAVPGSGKAIVQKGWDERLNETPVLESDADEQLIVIVPFTGQVKLHSILIHPTSSPHSPSIVHVYANREDLDFSAAADAKPTQTLEIPLQPPSATAQDVIELPVKRALFNNVRNVALFFPENHSGGEEDVTRISYLGLKGDWTKVNREPVMVTYELAPNPADHKIPGVKSGLPGGLGSEGGGTGDAN